MSDDFFAHRLKPNQKVKLKNITTRGKELHDDRDEAEKECDELREELAEWQNRLYAEGKQRLLVVLQATDAGGKDSTIRKVFCGVNPQGVRVASFKKPTPEVLAHDFLWRIHSKVPATGMIQVFNRSHYEDVLVVRVHDIVPREVWEPRYELINEFEKLLSDSGTTILKFYLHISKDEQKERFQARLDDPNKTGKFSTEDLEKRKHWADYMSAFEDMLERCTTEHAPWFVIPADQKWYRNLAILRSIVGTLREMNPEYPNPEEGLDQIEIE